MSDTLLTLQKQIPEDTLESTFEERINHMISSKRELAELTVGTGENWIGNLPNKDLRDIFELQHD